ncbi:Uma2 family endonuclease [Nonomuraea typhae]|uniref:Uma2 family endonuclease n=1 Tax=Nonomuraea typhae TaxID=2603600 RepID=A0ABW7ZAN6_9ACTN
MTETRDPLESWPYPPDDGWTSDDLDLFPDDGPGGELDLFKGVQLVDGALILRAAQTRLHSRLTDRLYDRLRAQAPAHLRLSSRMDIKIDRWQRPCPDLLVIDAEAARDMSRTFFDPQEVHLVVEIVSTESEHRDVHVKPRIYAKAGIQHYWTVLDTCGKPVIHAYELDKATGSYSGVGIFRSELELEFPFPVTLDVADLLR